MEELRCLSAKAVDRLHNSELAADSAPLCGADARPARSPQQCHWLQAYCNWVSYRPPVDPDMADMGGARFYPARWAWLAAQAAGDERADGLPVAGLMRCDAALLCSQSARAVAPLAAAAIASLRG